MDSTSKHTPANTQNAQTPKAPSFCWKELLDSAFTGWEPADQALERIIDRMGKSS